MQPGDYANGVTKDDLRRMLAQVPNIQQNAALRQALMELIAAEVIQAIPYTYTIAYWLTGAFNAIAVGAANVQGKIDVQSDADFLIMNHTFWANTANAVQNAGNRVTPNVTVLLTDTGSGYNQMDQALPIANLFGTGQFPYVLPEPKLLPAKSTLQAQATNLDPAVACNLFLSFNGVKLFKY